MLVTALGTAFVANAGSTANSISSFSVGLHGELFLGTGAAVGGLPTTIVGLAATNL